MNTTDRVLRVRELMLNGTDPLPFTRTTNSNLVDAMGNKVIATVRQSDFVGVHPSNDHNAELIEHLTHLAVEGQLQNTTNPSFPGEVHELQEEIHAMANRLFPDRTPAKAWLKLFEELGEVIKNPADETEWGDVFILLFDLAKMHNIHIVNAVRNKAAVLDSRVWYKTLTGTYQHVKGTTVQETEQRENELWPTLSNA